MKLSALGDSAITISFAEETVPDAAALLRRAWAVKEAIDEAALSGVVETISSYDSVSVFIDPLVPLSQGIPPAEVGEWFNQRLLQAASKADKRGRLTNRAKEREIPVCFDDQFAPDLLEVARTAGSTSEEVIERFCGATYEVACIGFTPGFPYLMGLPLALATPRKATPRSLVPAGSVAIGGSHAGIYPGTSPGGWNIIGRSPLKFFAPEKNPPSLLVASDRVRFKRISSVEFESYRSAANAS